MTNAAKNLLAAEGMRRAKHDHFWMTRRDSFIPTAISAGIYVGAKHEVDVTGYFRAPDPGPEEQKTATPYGTGSKGRHVSA